MNGRKSSWLLRAGSFLLAALMVFGNLCLPNGIFQASAEETNTSLFSTDFENYTVDASPAQTDEYWTVSQATAGVGSAEIKEINGNKVLAVSTTVRPDSSSNTDLTVFRRLQKNGAKYNNVTISYNVAVAKTGVLFFPTVGAYLSAGSEKVKFGMNGTANIRWTQNGTSWQDVITGTDTKIPLNTLQWYTVKVVYAVGTEQATCQVYINGVLTDVAAYTTNLPVGSLIMTASKFGSGEMYVDNIQVTTGDHTPAEAPITPVTSYYAEDFDAKEVGSAGGWYGDTGSFAVAENPCNGNNKALVVNKTNTDGGKVLKVKPLSAAVKQAVLEYSLYYTDGVGVMYPMTMMATNTGDLVKLVLGSTGTLSYQVSGKNYTLASLNKGEKNTIKLAVDADKNEWYIWVNGEYIVPSQGNTLLQTDIQGLLINTVGSAAVSNVYFDDVKLTPYIPAADFGALKSEIALEVGGTEQLAWSFTPAAATVTDVLFASGDDTVATVDATGKVTAVKAGTADITITPVQSGLRAATVKVTVTEAAEESKDILNLDFDTESSEELKYTTSTNYKAEVIQRNGNKLLAVTNSDSNNHLLVSWTSGEGFGDHKIFTFSYHIAFEESKIVYMPALSNKSSALVNIGSRVTCNKGTENQVSSILGYSTDGCVSWTDVQVGGEQVGAVEALRWYTVKMVYDASGETPVITTYLDGELTNIVAQSTNLPNGFALNLTKWTGGKAVYLDDLRITAGDHAPADKPASLVEEEVEDVLHADFTDGKDVFTYTTSTDYKAEVIERNGNKLLAISNNATGSHLNVKWVDAAAFGNSKTYTFSYNIAFEAQKIYYMPSLSKDAGTLVNLGSRVTCNAGTEDAVSSVFGYSMDSQQTWKDVQIDGERVGTLDALTWYTVKMVYDATGETPVIKTYFDGKLTNVENQSTATPNGIAFNVTKWTGGNAMYLDDLRITVEDHEPAAKPASLIVESEPEEDQELLNITFEDGTSGGIQISGPSVAYGKVVEKNGNKLLELGNSDINTHAFARIALGKSYKNLTVSYHFGVSDKTGIFYLPVPSATVATKSTGKLDYTTDGSSWTQLTQVADATKGATYEPLTWYTVKIAFDGTGAAPSVKVWIDGVEMTVGARGALSIDTLTMQMTKWMNNQLAFIDNLRVTTGDHEPAAKPASLHVKTESIQFAHESMTIYANIPTNPEIIFTPAGATEKGVTLTSSDPEIAYIDKDGNVVGLKNGTVTITADPVAEGVENATMQLTVVVINATKVEIHSEDLTLPVGGHTVISSTVSPENASFADVVYTSSDERIATIDEYGEIVALKAGTVTLTAAAADNAEVNDSITLTVFNPEVMDTIYVSANGQDDAAGTKDAPVSLKGALALIAAKNDNMTGNIEVVLAGGYYYMTETLKITEAHSGTNHYSVVWKAAEGETPVIGSAYTVSGTWTKDASTGIYSVDVPAGLDSRQLYVNHVRAVRARSEGGLTASKFLLNSAGTNIGYISKDLQLAKFAIPEDLELVFKEEWTQPRIGVASITDNGDGTVSMVMDQPGWSYLLKKGQTNPKEHGPVWIENALELLDEPGEWYLDTKNDKLYYMPRAWEDMSKVTVTLPAMDQYNGGNEQQLFLIEGASYDNRVENIHFEGITFADTTWLRPNTTSGHSDVQNNHIRESGDKLQTAAVVVKKATAVWFTGCTFTRLGITGLQMVDGVQNSFIIGNRFYDISGSAINIGDPGTGSSIAHAQGNAMMKNNDILNNYIHDIGVDYGSAAAISVGFAANMDMSHNEIFDTPYSGWHIGYGWNNRFPNNNKNMLLEYNFVHDFMDEDIYDGGGIYTLGNTSGEGYNIARYNYFRNQMDAHGALYADQGTTWFKFIENVIDYSEVDSWMKGTRTPAWMMTNQVTEHIHYINNYTTVARYSYSVSLDPVRDDITIENLMVDPTAKWEGTNAQSIMAAAGLEAEYAYLRNGQAERIVSNTPKTGLELNVGDSYQFVVGFTDGKDNAVSGGNTIVHWESMDTSVATISESGLIEAVGQGMADIRVWVVSNNILDVKDFSVVVDDKMTAVKLGGVLSDITMSKDAVGKQLSASIVTVLGRELAAETVTYKIADANVATVTEDGYLKPAAPGTTTLTVTATLEGESITSVYRVRVTEKVEYAEDNAWEIFDKSAEDKWHQVDVTGWEMVDDTSITYTPGNRGFATFTGAQYADELLSFKLKVDASKGGGGWPAIVLRAQSTNTYVSAGVDGYILCMGTGGLELYRYNGTVRHVIYGNFYENGTNVNIDNKQGDAIKDSAWTFDANKVAEHDIKIGAISDGGDVRIVLIVDGEEVINYLDKAEDGAMSNAGYFGIVGRTGEVWTLTKNTQITDEEPEAKIGEKQYTTLHEALDNAKEGDTVQLLADAELDTLFLDKGITLDLNGCDLRMDYLIAFADDAVIDSTNGVGALKCEHVRLAADNPAMPVWDAAAGGYRFFEMKSQQKYSAQTENGFVFMAKPVLASHANDIFLAQSQTNGLTIKVRLNWTSNSGKAVEQFFILDAADMAEIYSEENKVIQLNVTGAGAYANKLYTTCYIESETGVIWAPNGRLYTGE